MAAINRLPSGRWRVQLRRWGSYASKTFRLKADAEQWARAQEDSLERGEGITLKAKQPHETLGDLIELHLADMAEVGRAARRSKEFTLRRLNETIGKLHVAHLSRERVIEFGRRRAKEGAGPVTISMDLSYLHLILEHAAAIYGYSVPTEQLRLGRAALLRLGLVGKSNVRDRRPTEDELGRILACVDNNPRLLLPLGRIIKFAIATAMRQEEITRILWDDYDPAVPSVVVRQRKHPREKSNNDQTVVLVSDTGFDAVALLAEQRNQSSSLGSIFPYNARSVGAAFRRVCRDLQIDDLHFHDLRHEGISRLFEADWDIPQVAAVSGHKDWKMLQRYTHLRPTFIASRAGRVRQPALRLPQRTQTS